MRAPLPYDVDTEAGGFETIITDSDCEPIASLVLGDHRDELVKEAGDYMVHAANCHEDLLAACQRALEDFVGRIPNALTAPCSRELYDMLTAAINKAKP